MTIEVHARAGRLLRPAAGLAAALVTAGLAAAIVALPPPAAGPAVAVQARLLETGASHPVTAVLLDFRSYDTLLELGVLLLAAIAIVALRRGEPARLGPGSHVLTILVRVQVPFMVLIAGYVLWAGTAGPGGAFQAGALLAAAGVLAKLAGVPVFAAHGRLALRAGLAAGFATFVAIGLATALHSGTFLDYPASAATILMLLLEFSATVSVALTLLGMFVSVMYDGGRDAANAGGTE